ncbi:hypothetical protein [Kurthia huakuii]|uniref:hypothetical protein n=1 Tax=Kurthia huakuii TaxID=1421019 RepID=UPI0004958FFB|nr:hypothetical protein [Kurthia huakuii]MBM7699438.1 hypothetical protein [Kurthia huakuii]
MKIKIWLIKLRFNIQLYVGKIRLLGYAVLVEILLGMGDITLFLVYPEMFVILFLLTVGTIMWKKLRPYVTQMILKRRMFLIPVLCLFGFNHTK